MNLIFRIGLILCLTSLGCGQPDSQDYTIDTEGWSPTEFVDGVPVYSSVNQYHEKHVRTAWEILRENDITGCEGWDTWSLNWVLP